jgi:hypothetical protein
VYCARTAVCGLAIHWTIHPSQPLVIPIERYSRKLLWLGHSQLKARPSTRYHAEGLDLPHLCVSRTIINDERSVARHDECDPLASERSEGEVSRPQEPYCSSSEDEE